MRRESHVNDFQKPRVKHPNPGKEKTPAGRHHCTGCSPVPHVHVRRPLRGIQLPACDLGHRRTALRYMKQNGDLQLGEVRPRRLSNRCGTHGVPVGRTGNVVQNSRPRP